MFTSIFKCADFLLINVQFQEGTLGTNYLDRFLHCNFLWLILRTFCFSTSVSFLSSYSFPVSSFSLFLSHFFLKAQVSVASIVMHKLSIYSRIRMFKIPTDLIYVWGNTEYVRFNLFRM